MNMPISELLPPLSLIMNSNKSPSIIRQEWIETAVELKRKKKGTYLLKCECQSCGYIARVTAKWIDQAGEPICPTDQEPMICS